ncbi:MAG: glutamyl-tRNA reductase [Gammaproteobacteria bacterium]|nr:MAG: glutamyl-tRNA reductase [Gammaproteobacteria bacterium]
MSLLAIGLSHTTAPVQVREKVVIPPEETAAALHDLVAHTGVAEAAIISTCNRTEIYCGVEQEVLELPRQWLREYRHLRHEEIDPFLYTHQDRDAVRHILRVAAGLDSMVLGEPQILGQMKDAYRLAREAGVLGQQLEKLFQHSFAVAKKIRASTGIGSSPVSVAFAAVTLARRIFGDLSGQTVLLLGAGDTVELTARHLAGKGVDRMIFANRTLSRADELARQFSAYAITLDDVHKHLSDADIIIASTGASEPVLSTESLRNALKERKRRPFFIVDIAVPRDVEASAADLDDVYLYTVDDLQQVIQEGLNSRREAAAEAEAIVNLWTDHFSDWQRSLSAVQLIRDYRHLAEEQRDRTLEKARALLARGDNPEDVLRFLANTLTNKLLHQPSVSLRRAARTGRKEVLDIARGMLGLTDRSSSTSVPDDPSDDSSDAARPDPLDEH